MESAYLNSPMKLYPRLSRPEKMFPLPAHLRVRVRSPSVKPNTGKEKACSTIFWMTDLMVSSTTIGRVSSDR